MLFWALLFVAISGQAAEKKPWTFLVYMAVANDLHSYAFSDLEEMMNIGSNDMVNIIAYLTVQENGQPKVTKKMYINKDSMVQIGNDMIRDSGDVAALEEALQWACLDYPSDHIVVVLSSHGSGPLNRSKKLSSRGVCYDFDSGHYLTDRDCLEAFSWARDTLRRGKKIDIIAFEASFLASLEMAYTLSSCADYMVASEEAVSGDGYRYAALLADLETNNLDPLFFAQLMVRTYNNDRTKTTNYTLSVADLNSVDRLVDNCNAVAQILKNQLLGKNNEMVKATIKKCINVKFCPSFDQGIYIDLCQFYKNLLKNISGLKLPESLANQFKAVVSNGIKLFGTVVKANVASVNNQNIGGLSIYFSRHSIDPSYYGVYWTEKNPNWLDFLEAYLA